MALIRNGIDGYNNNQLDHQLETIHHALEEIGHSPETIRIRETEILTNVLNPYKAALRDEVNKAQRELTEMRKNVQGWTARMAEITEEMRLQPFEVDSTLPLIRLSSLLKEKIEQLEAKREERMRLLRECITTNERYCMLLGKAPFAIDHHRVPSEQQLGEMSAVNVKLGRERDSRFQRLNDLWREIQTLLQDLGHTASTALHKTLLDGPLESFPLIDESLQNVAADRDRLALEKEKLVGECRSLQERCMGLRNRLSMTDPIPPCLDQNTRITSRVKVELTQVLGELEELKRQNMKKFIQELYTELDTICHKCYEPVGNKTVLSREFDDAHLELVEKEIEKWKRYYEKYAAFFQKVKRRDDLFKIKTECDMKECDPDFWKNRGGLLTKTKAEKAKAEAELKKLDEEIKNHITAWQEDQGRQFTVYGQPYYDFLASQIKGHSDLLEERKANNAQDVQDAKNLKAGGPLKRKNDGGKDVHNNKVAKGNLGVVPRSPLATRYTPLD